MKKKTPKKTYPLRVTVDLASEEDKNFLTAEAKKIGDKIGIAHVLRTLVTTARKETANVHEAHANNPG